MGFLILVILYWVATAIVFLTGLIMLVVNSIKNKSTKKSLRVLITGVVMLVIGGGTCALILGSLKGL